MTTVISPSKYHGEILSTSQRSNSTPSHKSNTDTTPSFSNSKNNNNNTSLMMVNNMIHENTTYEAIIEQIRNIILQYASTFVYIYHRNNNMIQYTQLIQKQIQATIKTIQHTVHAFTFIEDENDNTAVGTIVENSSNEVIASQNNDIPVELQRLFKSIQLFRLRSQQHKVRRRTLQQHGTLLVELLDIPNLMDICIKSSISTSHNNLNSNTDPSTLNETTTTTTYYDEALQIASFANTLERRHGCITNVNDSDSNRNSSSNTTTTATTTSGGNRIIHQIIQQIRIRQQDLRRHLLLRLRGNSNNTASNSTATKSSSSSSSTTTMSECLEIITALRRLNAIDLESYSYQIQQQTNNESNMSITTHLEHAHSMMEYQLQIEFLEARDVWLDSINKAMDTTMLSGDTTGNLNPLQNETVLDMIERYRTRMFEIATQYNAIFSSSTTRSTVSTSTKGNISSSQLLALWITRRVQCFLALLRQELSLSVTAAANNTAGTSTHVDAATIRDAIEAAVFFATSLGRLGADFTCQLSNIFEPLLVQTITQYWKDGVDQFHNTLEICRDAGIAGPLATVSDVQLVDGLPTDASEAFDIIEEISFHEPQPPPKRLLSLPPVARLVNAILTGLNELRRCLLPGVFSTLRRYLRIDVIQVIKDQLQLNERIVSTPGFRGDASALRSIASVMIKTFHDIVEPFILGSLETALGYNTAAIMYHQQLYENLQRLRAATNIALAAADDTSKVDPEISRQNVVNEGAEDNENPIDVDNKLVVAIEVGTIPITDESGDEECEHPQSISEAIQVDM